MALRLLSYNILMGGEDRLPLIASVIQKQQAHVVALLEANEHSNAEALAHQLGMSLIFGEANNEFSVAWLSRYPITRMKNHRLPMLAKTLLEIEILWEGPPLTLFATHLRAGRNAEHDYARATEMQAILDILHMHNDRPHVLVGDLNTIHPTDDPDISALLTQKPDLVQQRQFPQFPRQVIPLLLQAGYIDCYRTLHPTTPGYTYPLPVPALRLDYIFASPLLAEHLHACDIVLGTEAEQASDHFPLWAEFI